MNKSNDIRLLKEGNQTVTNRIRLKMQAEGSDLSDFFGQFNMISQKDDKNLTN